MSLPGNPKAAFDEGSLGRSWSKGLVCWCPGCGVVLVSNQMGLGCSSPEMKGDLQREIGKRREEDGKRERKR